jgi:hypothetical protein
MRKILLVTLLILSGCLRDPVQAGGSALARIGPTCPPGYYRNNAYCVPHSASAKQALPRIGYTCPVGYYRNGPYCLKSK